MPVEELRVETSSRGCRQRLDQSRSRRRTIMYDGSSRMHCRRCLECLNSALLGLVDTAMTGSRPWVISVNIVCGCGNQILSEVVPREMDTS